MILVKNKLYYRLHKCSDTAHLYVMTFRDPINKFAQSFIITKETPWEKVAEMWDKIHETAHNELRKRRWGLN